MKKMLIIIDIIFIIIGIKLISTICINEYFIQKYKQNEYNTSIVKSTLFLNIYEPYIAHYNYGNILYKNKNFEEAIKEYERALTLFPTEERECSIRINLALAMLQKIDIDNENKTLEILKQAKQVLCEKGCAHENDYNGHSKTAEQLKKDIEKMEENLKNQEESEVENNNQQEQKDQENENVEEQLKQIREETRLERQKEIDQIEHYGDYDYYSGKSW